ncbi:MAG: hypothetical protein ACLQNE_07615, partial [Thermoguttaceae bacterium]
AIQPTWQICHSERSEESGLVHGQRRSFAPLRMTTSHLKPEEPVILSLCLMVGKWVHLGELQWQWISLNVKIMPGGKRRGCW